MSNYLYESNLYTCKSDSIQLAQLLELIPVDTETNPLNKTIQDEFPIENFGNPNDTLAIKGTKELYNQYQKVIVNKIDVIESLENLEYMGLTDKNEIILHFKAKPPIEAIKTTGIYNSRKDFFDDVFRMGKFSQFCIEKGFKDLLKENIDELIVRLKDEKRQFRLIEHQNKWLLRGITSWDKYKNYDNNIALYLALLSLHKYAKEKRLNFYIENAQMSDSNIDIFFEQEEPIKVNNLGYLHFGIHVSNNEIRKSPFIIQLRYKITDENNYYFNGTLKKSILNIQHSCGIDKAKIKVSEIFKIDKFQDEILEHITKIQNTTDFTREAIYDVMNQIVHNNNLKKETKDNAKTVFKETVENTWTLIRAFNSMNEITTDLSEKIYIEQLLHEIIAKSSNKKKQITKQNNH
ncbi:TPA: hypothetical protein QCX34_005611 [Bacillus anthracis]|uniref:hypothetical protein n=1 Tax=Bacillus wiedmannii TaxID=1890302 RepID=UPI000BF0D648|nr:hypothetical protein [Bacillus wiedmannii]PEM24062.1 hypothetical protein CN617_25100 [Bacillus wiedmannii]HDR7437966.1 hypothetical protein [Bacillus anthracis]